MRVAISDRGFIAELDFSSGMNLLSSLTQD
jgi:hypothetical protein